MSTHPIPRIPEMESADCDPKGFNALKIVGWFSAGLVVAVLSIYAAAEIRSRYLFNKRTPYDFYSNVGEQPTGEFGVGI
jgi:hypothetical protein